MHVDFGAYIRYPEGFNPGSFEESDITPLKRAEAESATGPKAFRLPTEMLANLLNNSSVLVLTREYTGDRQDAALSRKDALTLLQFTYETICPLKGDGPQDMSCIEAVYAASRFIEASLGESAQFDVFVAQRMRQSIGAVLDCFEEAYTTDLLRGIEYDPAQ